MAVKSVLLLAMAGWVLAPFIVEAAVVVLAVHQTMVSVSGGQQEQALASLILLILCQTDLLPKTALALPCLLAPQRSSVCSRCPFLWWWAVAPLVRHEDDLRGLQNFPFNFLDGYSASCWRLNRCRSRLWISIRAHSGPDRPVCWVYEILNLFLSLEPIPSAPRLDNRTLAFSLFCERLLFHHL